MRLNEALHADISNYEPVESGSVVAQSLPPIPDLQPIINSMIRCPLPYATATSDSLRQFYMGGRVPQTRLLNSAASK